MPSRGNRRRPDNLGENVLGDAGGAKLQRTIEKGEDGRAERNDERLLECLKDKASATYQNSLDFAEAIAVTESFSSHFSLTPLRYATLEQALEAESGNTDLLAARRENDAKGLSNLVVPPPTQSPLLRKLFGELLTALGHRVDQASSNGQHFNQVLWRVLKAWAANSRDDNDPINDSYFASFIAECSEEEREVCCWPEKMKLALVRTAINALLSSPGHVDLCESMDMENLRLPPFAIDKQWRKYWFFGDTYLFLEENEESMDNSKSAVNNGEDTESPVSTPKRSRKRRSGKSSIVKKKMTPLVTTAVTLVDREENEANSQLLTASRLRIVCKTADDWERLANIYSERDEKEVAEALRAMASEVRELEQKRLKEEMLSSVMVRSSSRVQQRREERQLEEERQRQLREEHARVEKEERRRMLLYAQNDSDRHMVLNAYEGVQTNQLDREERMRLREQRKAEQQADVIGRRRNGKEEDASTSHPLNGYSHAAETSHLSAATSKLVKLNGDSSTTSDRLNHNQHLVHNNQRFHHQRYYNYSRPADYNHNHPYQWHPSTSNSQQVPRPSGSRHMGASAYYHRSPYAKLGERGIVVVVDTMEEAMQPHAYRIGLPQRQSHVVQHAAKPTTSNGPISCSALRANLQTVDHDHCYARRRLGCHGGLRVGNDN